MTTFRAGDVVAEKYRIEKLLGKGGMGSVYSAQHLHLDQRVAIKFLNPLAIDDFEARGRFQQEARAAVRFRSEHVAQVYDVGLHGPSQPFIVMEYLEGQDLSALLVAVKRVSMRDTTEYVLQACEALGEAHAMGIIHRDIKLANLFVTRGASGAMVLKLLDFGISKTLTNEPGGMTKTSAMLGSPKFMSPEQMTDARAVDARTDIWSLGVVLYRLTSGRAPFDADTVAGLLAMVSREEPRPLRSLVPDLAAGFEQVVARCLEKDRSRRFPSVAHLAAALVPYAADPVLARERVSTLAGILGVPIPAVAGSTAARPPLAEDATSRTSGSTRRSSLPPPRTSARTSVRETPAVSEEPAPLPSPLERIKSIDPVFASIAALALALLFGTFMIVRSQEERREREQLAPVRPTEASPPPPQAIPLAPPMPTFPLAPPSVTPPPGGRRRR